MKYKGIEKEPPVVIPDANRVSKVPFTEDDGYEG